jgi:hypothetical protein
MKNLVTKKNTLLVAIIGITIFIVSVFPELFKLCGSINIQCGNFFETTAEIMMIFVVVFLLSLATYPLSEKIFSAWVKFAKWWVPLTIILSILSAFGEQPSYMPSMISPDIISLFMTSILLAVSLILIAHKYFMLRKGEVGK